MTRTSLPDDTRSGGFVLVGVVMFVLALTILGLSVFSLSSYEAQFLRTSRDEVQAFNDAMGGLERAVYAIASTDSLEAARVYLPAGVDSSRAWQKVPGGGIRVNGPVSDTVWVKVAARRGSTQRTVIAGFRPTSNENYYTRTLHSASSIALGIGVSGEPNPATGRANSVRLGNSIRQLSTDFAWLGFLANPIPTDATSMSLPVPSAPTFIADNWAAAVQAPYDASEQAYELRNPIPNTVKYFMWPTPSGPQPTWTLDDNAAKEIEVEGMVVWMIPNGVHFEFEMEVKRAGPAGRPTALVIVATPGLQTESALFGMRVGIEFFGGLKSSEVPVILVSDGVVSLDQSNNYDKSLTVNYLSAFAGGIWLRGPRTGWVSWFRHDDNAPEDRPGGIIEKLIQLRALPNATGGAVSRFEMIAGTWQDVTP